MNCKRRKERKRENERMNEMHINSMCTCRRESDKYLHAEVYNSIFKLMIGKHEIYLFYAKSMYELF